ncbi:hypothetical protein ElyMa_002822300 [Elysia marginata]|uniref:PIN domain-containing protein n=1 Tax=Elysia marginata TaxID=1093978 RepID=A0AAV4HUX1_9GAST|nr:hypothetical protein ElyMa_002822300 [Elysia marginata]
MFWLHGLKRQQDCLVVADTSLLATKIACNEIGCMLLTKNPVLTKRWLQLASYIPPLMPRGLDTHRNLAGEDVSAFCDRYIERSHTLDFLFAFQQPNPLDSIRI